MRANLCLSLASLQVWPCLAATQCLSALQPQNSVHRGWLASWSSPLKLPLAGCCAWLARTEASFWLSQVGFNPAQIQLKSASAAIAAPTSACFLSHSCMMVQVCVVWWHRSHHSQGTVLVCAVICGHVCRRNREETSQELADSINQKTLVWAAPALESCSGAWLRVGIGAVLRLGSSRVTERSESVA